MERPDLANLLRRAAAAQRGAWETLLAELDLTPAQFALLNLVTQSPGISAADIARWERLTPATVSVIIANLERRAAIQRRRDPANARILRLEATPLGASLAERGERAAAAWRNKIAESLDGEGEASVRGWLARVAEMEI